MASNSVGTGVVGDACTETPGDRQCGSDCDGDLSPRERGQGAYSQKVARGPAAGERGRDYSSPATASMLYPRARSLAAISLRSTAFT
jgi:hypothetical protein